MTNTRNYVAERISSAQSPQRKRRTALIADLRATYLETHRDQQLRNAFELLVDEAIAEINGHRVAGRVLAVHGGSGAGKSVAIRNLISSMPELRSFDTEIGVLMPIVSLQAPSPYSLKQLGLDLLRKMGFEARASLNSPEIWRRVRHQFKLHQTLVVHVDEVQHVLRDVDTETTQQVRDTLKICMEGAAEEWPVSFLLSGLPTIVDFIDREKSQQQDRRHATIEFPPLSMPGDESVVEGIVEQIAEESAKLKVNQLKSAAFSRQLAHAARCQFGRIVDLVIYACLTAVAHNDKSLTKDHFATVYADQYACRPEMNIFSAENWHKISPGSPREEDRFIDGMKISKAKREPKHAGV